MRKNFDIKDLQIISCLRENSRQSLKDMAKKVLLPISTIYDRMRRLEKDGLIMKYTVLVDFKKLDHPIKVNLFLKTDMNKTKFEDCAVGDLSVNSVTKLTGDEYSYLIEGVFPNMDRLSQYLEKITENYGVIGYKVYYVTNELKTEGFLISDAAGLQKIGTAASA